MMCMSMRARRVIRRPVFSRDDTRVERCLRGAARIRCHIHPWTAGAARSSSPQWPAQHHWLQKGHFNPNSIEVGSVFAAPVLGQPAKLGAAAHNGLRNNIGSLPPSRGHLNPNSMEVGSVLAAPVLGQPAQLGVVVHDGLRRLVLDEDLHALLSVPEGVLLGGGL